LPKPLSISRRGPLELFVFSQVRPHFHRLFTGSRAVCFPLAGVLTVFVGLTTLFSITRAGVARPHPRYACYPCPSKRDSTPRLFAGFLSRTSARSSCDSHADLSPELSPTFLDFSIPVDDFQPRGFSGPHRPGDSSGFITCRMLGLHTTPADFAQQRILTAYHPVSGIPSDSALIGLSLDESSFSGIASNPRICPVYQIPFGLCLIGPRSHEHPRRVGPGYRIYEVVTPRLAVVCLQPLQLRFAVRRSSR
jgi:hypothetical protein